MHKKILFGIIFLAMIVAFSFTYSFATDDNNNMGMDAVNGVRNAVGGAENAVENAARDISNTSKDATGDMENDAQNSENNDNSNGSKDDNSQNNLMGGTNGNNGSNGSMGTNSDYTATRTATGTTDNTLFGMNSTAWIWLILAVAAVAIIALVFYYSNQMNSNKKNYDDQD